MRDDTNTENFNERLQSLKLRTLLEEHAHCIERAAKTQSERVRLACFAEADAYRSRILFMFSKLYKSTG